MHKITRVLCMGIALLLPSLMVCGQAPPKTAPTQKSDRPPAPAHQHHEIPPELKPASFEGDPTPEPKPTPEPSAPAQAKLVAPAQVPVNAYVVLDFAGTTSAVEPDFDVVSSPAESKVAITKLYSVEKTLLYGMVVPDKAGAYRIALIAAAPSGPRGEVVRSYAFADISAVEGTPTPPPNPDPTPTPGPLPDPTPGPTPGPTPPLPTPPTPVTDTYGMYAFSNSTIAKFPTMDPWQGYCPIIADVFDKMIAQKSSFTDATKYVEATSSAYKQALGSSYSWWSFYYFDYIKAQLGKINASGKLPSTVDAHAVVWSELSQSLRAVKQPPVSTSKKGAARR